MGNRRPYLNLLKKMRPLLILLSLIALIGCKPTDTARGGDTKLPAEYRGSWMFDEGAATVAIESMSLSEEDKLKLQSSFIGMIRDETRQVDEAGRITGDSYPDELVIRLHVVEERDDGTVMSTSNSMNPDAKQFTLNTISDGVWRARLLDDSLQVAAGIPDDFWKRYERKTAEQGMRDDAR